MLTAKRFKITQVFSSFIQSLPLRRPFS
ncbi:unnamed protein product, partial [Vitis vinifera]|uniref:Uncharacterized protein n=1 Tax=Vitis vinifera TaxID=29760 RepID=D7UC39_VITVI